jgi:hypothetical protein
MAQSAPHKPSSGADTRPGGRWLFAALALMAGGLLLGLGQQTQPGFGNGDWWNEPRNGPMVSLSLLFVFSALAAVFAAPRRHTLRDRDTALALALSAGFLVAVWLIGILGYGLSVLCFTAFAGMLAGFRGRRLAWLSLGLTLAMVLLFREALGLWFPRAWLYRQADWLSVIGQYL